MPKQGFKVLTYNIHKGFSPGNRRFVLHQMKSALQSMDADVIFLQEIQGHHSIKSDQYHNWPDESQFEFLADQIWSHHAYAKNAIYKSGHHGNAILSKFPFVQWENIDVSYMKSASRSLLHGEIKISDALPPVHVICVHLGLFSVERKLQLAKLVQRIDEHVPHNEPLIIAGDFNDWQGRCDSYFRKELDITEVFKADTGRFARTFPAWMPLLTMDRIYSRGLHLTQCHRLHDKSWRELSDHLPLMAEFEISAG